MAYEVVILESAQRELQQIIDYLCDALKSAQAAKSFMDGLEAQIALIEGNPELFALSRMPELAIKGYRVALIKNYGMLYTLREEKIHVAHFFHQRQDYARLI